MKSNGKYGFRNIVSSTALAVGMMAGAVALPPAAYAQSAATQHFDIAVDNLAAGLQRFSAQTGIQLIYSSDLVVGKRASAVSGDMTPSQALSQLLAGTGLMASLNGNSATIASIQDSVAPGASEHVLGAVRVEGEQGSPYFGGAGQMAGVNGINGSRDITATEGTKSFTSGALSVASKAPQALKDVPQSISVLTNERMQQQNVTDFTSAMAQLPGITLVQGTTSLENTFYSRGYAITSIQVDGGAPLTTLYGFYPQIDMSIYDHVELVRGANGLFDGYGDPGGTVNLVRKKPLDHPQVLLEGQAGNWDNYRVMADATTPLAMDGRLRGRLVMTWQDNHHFYDIAKDNKELIYGIAEFDATPTTLLTAGINYTQQDSVPWQGGLPRYEDGTDLKLPRSTCLCFPWNRWNFNTTEIFGEAEQKIADDWKLKVNLTRNRQNSTQKVGFNIGSINPLTGTGGLLSGNYSHSASNQFSAEATVTGSFTIFGQRQEITIGANRVSSDAGGQLSYQRLIVGTASAPYQPYPGGPTFYPGSPNGRLPPIDVFDFNPDDPLYTEPRNPLPAMRYLIEGTVQTGAYANLRLTAFDRLHLTTGLRWSQYVNKLSYESLCTRVIAGLCSAIGDPFNPTAQTYREKHFDWPPPVNISFDITKRLTAYAGWTNIYRSQAFDLDSAHKPLPPIRGSNLEAGLKWAAWGGKLNFALSVYKLKQKGWSMPDPNIPTVQISPGVTCCYLYDPNQTLLSKGIDFEVTGQVRPGWQIAASYNYNDNKQEGSDYGTSVGLPFTSIQPKNVYKIWTSYDFGAAGYHGFVSGLTVSGGFNGQSSAYNAGSVCVNPGQADNSCVSFGPPDFLPYHFTSPGYFVASARIDYRFSPHWSLAVNLDNLLDKTYYQTVGYPNGSNWYGAPRNVMATLRAKW